MLAAGGGLYPDARPIGDAQGPSCAPSETRAIERGPVVPSAHRPVHDYCGNGAVMVQ